MNRASMWKVAMGVGVLASMAYHDCSAARVDLGTGSYMNVDPSSAAEPEESCTYIYLHEGERRSRMMITFDSDSISSMISGYGATEGVSDTLAGEPARRFSWVLEEGQPETVLWVFDNYLERTGSWGTLQPHVLGILIPGQVRQKFSSEVDRLLQGLHLELVDESSLWRLVSWGGFSLRLPATWTDNSSMGWKLECSPALHPLRNPRATYDLVFQDGKGPVEAGLSGYKEVGGVSIRGYQTTTWRREYASRDSQEQVSEWTVVPQGLPLQGDYFNGAETQVQITGTVRGSDADSTWPLLREIIETLSTGTAGAVLPTPDDGGQMTTGTGGEVDASSRVVPISEYPDLSGSWTAYVNDEFAANCRIEQDGASLVFVILRSSEVRSPGRFATSTHVVADDWGSQEGTISSDGARINWADSYWVKDSDILPQTPPD